MLECQRMQLCRRHFVLMMCFWYVQCKRARIWWIQWVWTSSQGDPWIRLRIPRILWFSKFDRLCRLCWFLSLASILGSTNSTSPMGSLGSMGSIGFVWSIGSVGSVHRFVEQKRNAVHTFLLRKKARMLHECYQIFKMFKSHKRKQRFNKCFQKWNTKRKSKCTHLLRCCAEMCKRGIRNVSAAFTQLLERRISNVNAMNFNTTHKGFAFFFHRNGESASSNNNPNP